MEEFTLPSSFQPVLRCQIHKQGIVIKGCMDCNCRRNTLMCQQCINEDQHMEHYNSVVDIKQFSELFPKEISKTAKDNKDQLEKYLMSSDNIQVYKYLQDNKQHLRRVKDNIDSQKTLIAKDITDIVESINLKLQEIKQEQFKKIDIWYVEYEAQFAKLRQSFHQTFNGAAQYYYCNPSSFQCKLAQCGLKAEEYVRMLKGLKDTRDNGELQRQGYQLLQLSECLSYKSELAKLDNQLQECMSSYFNQQLSNQSAPSPRIQQDIRPYSRQPSRMTETMVINKQGQNVQFMKSNPQSRMQWIHFKPLRLFQLDFELVSVIAFSANQFLLVGANDGKLRLFDREVKSINCVDGHTSPVVWIEQMDNTHFLTGANDGSVYYWEFLPQNTKPVVLDKLQYGNRGVLCALDLQNGKSFAFIDCDGRIGYRNIQSKQEIFMDYFRTSRIKKYRLALCKDGEMFYAFISGESGGALIQVSEKENKLRVLSARNLPATPGLIQMSMDEIYLISSNGIKISNVFSGEQQNGNEMDVLTFEYPVDKTRFVVTLPIESGTPQQYRIVDNKISQQDIVLEKVSYIPQKQRPRIQLVKNQDKVLLVIADSEHKCLNFYEVAFK